MSGHCDQARYDVVVRKEVAKRVRSGFDVLASLASIEANEPKVEVAVREAGVVSA